jgi:hypothetical protein
MNRQKGIHLALCTHIHDLWGNRLLDRNVAGNYPGCGWCSELKKDWSAGEVVTGDIAADRIDSGQWTSNDILIIQSDGSKQGRRLENLGCMPFLHLCWESPLYAFSIYDEIGSGRSLYTFHNMAAPPNGDNWPKKDGNSVMRMACLPGSQQNWAMRTRLYSPNRSDRIALVAGYKPLRSELKRCLKEHQWKSCHLGAVTDLKRLKSNTYHLARQNQTHGLRLRLIQHLGSVTPIDVFGRGWERYRPLSVRGVNLQGPCRSKLDTLQDYAYSLAMENCTWPGYHTEKLAEAIAAGTIPITLLDTETVKHIPRDCYIPINKQNPSETLRILTTINDSDRARMRLAGEAFLASSFARQYFEVDFARKIISDALHYIAIRTEAEKREANRR